MHSRIALVLIFKQIFDNEVEILKILVKQLSNYWLFKLNADRKAIIKKQGAPLVRMHPCSKCAYSNLRNTVCAKIFPFPEVLGSAVITRFV